MASDYIRDLYLQNMMYIKLKKLEIPLSLIDTLLLASSFQETWIFREDLERSNRGALAFA